MQVSEGLLGVEGRAIICLYSSAGLVWHGELSRVWEVVLMISGLWKKLTRFYVVPRFRFVQLLYFSISDDRKFHNDVPIYHFRYSDYSQINVVQIH